MNVTASECMEMFLRYYRVSDIAIFVLKRDVKLQLTNFVTTTTTPQPFYGPYASSLLMQVNIFLSIK